MVGSDRRTFLRGIGSVLPGLAGGCLRFADSGEATRSESGSRTDATETEAAATTTTDRERTTTGRDTTTTGAGDAPAHRWAFEEPDTETIATDSAGDMDGTVHGAEFVAGRDDTVLAFSDGEYVSMEGGGPQIGQPRTVTAWVRTTETKQMSVLTYGGKPQATGESFRALLNNQPDQGGEGVTIDVSRGGITYDATTSDGAWHHYAWVVPDVEVPKLSDVRVYQDGTQLTEIAHSFRPHQEVLTAGENLQLGRYREMRHGRLYLDGFLDDVRLYERALSTAEIERIVEGTAR